ncbi:hypothetical protein H8K35_06425 [Undibacterium sp. LX40W]|uniref:Uncharacterized protein n=1 Tax=Undibacterium nitidum TaxID=2762298 RepID=A0A923KMW4_9BURK|nr:MULTISPECIES: hypothetical protein [Undibacterium]MBC3879978.1 hypothetical protein [Undibacterium nitidum]MBC3891286.1 hypothetical protein [Undibacterium sp. LX40W]
MDISNYDKTGKGREEIATRKYQLPTRLRSLLVLVDGRQSDDDLLQKMAALGLNELSLQKLEVEGYIKKINGDEVIDSENFTASEQLNPPREQENQETPMIDSTFGPMGDLEESQTIFEASEGDDAWNANLDAILAAADDEDEDRESRVDMMKRYLSDLIKENLGIKGFFLQRRLLKAMSLEDIHAFRQDYVSAILHAKGKDKAIALRDQFDQRMYVRFSLTEPEFLEN